MATLAKDRKLAVVTGASSGIGFELAKQCAAHGFDLIICAETGINLVKSELAQGDLRVTAVEADLATPEGVEALYTVIEESGRAVDALLLNAGVGVGGAFLDTSLKDELQMIGLNVCSIVHLAKRVVPAMVARKQGRVLVTASIVSTAPAPYLAVYAGTKAFAMSFAEGIRAELKDTGVTVTALQPGATDTAFFDRAGMQDTAVAQGKKDDPAVVAKDGFDAMMAGKDSVIAGSLRSKLQGLANEILPETMKANQQIKTNKPGSGKAD